MVMQLRKNKTENVSLLIRNRLSCARAGLAYGKNIEINLLGTTGWFQVMQCNNTNDVFFVDSLAVVLTVD